MEISPKDLRWAGSSRKDMRGLPVAMRRDFGVGLFAVQCGEKPPSAKILKGFGGSGVLELVTDSRAGTYRAVYTVRFREAVDVLHVFQKKSKQGIATPGQEIDLIKQRLKWAQDDHLARMKEKHA